ncbi:cyanophycinase [Kangiella marina]|uniref:Cyanophycinase n=1 Tax=Kangiella marina TaxID=1079178 RepID=A0ABP8IBI9_9GAMM
MPSQGSGKFDRGYIIPIGGCSHSLYDDVAEQIRSVCLNASAAAIILNVGQEKVEHKLDKTLLSNGFEACDEVEVRSRQEANDELVIKRMLEKDLIVIVGERPLQISTIIGGTPVAKQLRKLNADGVHIAGSYGAAALLSEHMIAGGEDSITPKQDGVTMAPGLGLTNRFMLDYHFEQPGRLGRLLTALSYNPFTIGVGIDEGSALFISPKDELQVFGKGSATLIDPSNLQYSSMGTAGSGDLISLFGLQMHILAPGSRFKASDHKAFDEHWA